MAAAAAANMCGWRSSQQKRAALAAAEAVVTGRSARALAAVDARGGAAPHPCWLFPTTHLPPLEELLPEARRMIDAMVKAARRPKARRPETETCTRE